MAAMNPCHRMITTKRPQRTPLTSFTPAACKARLHRPGSRPRHRQHSRFQRSRFQRSPCMRACTQRHDIVSAAPALACQLPSRRDDDGRAVHSQGHPQGRPPLGRLAVRRPWGGSFVRCELRPFVSRDASTPAGISTSHHTSTAAKGKAIALPLWPLFLAHPS